jgi:hypothetical protein
MLESLKSLPDDPDDLKGLVALMGEEIKSLTLKVEDLQGQLAAHRKARFGSKSESLDQLAFDLQEDSEIAKAAQAQHDEAGPGGRCRCSPKRPPNGNTAAPRCPITSSDRPRFCLRAMPAPPVAAPCAPSART